MVSPQRFVVGVDGSECSLQALRWAVAEAAGHTAELVAVTTWTALPPPITSPLVDVNKIMDRADAALAAEQALRTALGNVLANDTRAAVETLAVEGHPAKVLVDQSRDADVVVVGARGRGGAAGWLLGSVSQELLRRSSCTVAVVRSPDRDEAANNSATYASEWTRVVVGVDGSDSSKSALRWAAEEARAHNAELTVVSVWTPAPIAAAPHGGVGWGAGLEPEALAAAVLHDTIEEVLSEDSGLALRREVRGGHAVAKVLIDVSDGADVLVVGSHGRGGFVGMLLGSVSQHVAAHAGGIVVVVR
jgi:nucleotide-binding universal stress UspA family protein